ncbi:MAG: tRNA dihydrouridine synthase DusB [Oscillospiraceae bacterium]|nr:tRNA dihydrouridine synthase DusB [Oscillospiraceae bacterium]
MVIGGIKIENPIILAPMAGVTDAAFRRMCAKHGANMTVTEMVSSRALVYQDGKTLTLLQRFEGESPCAAQIFGNDSAVMAKAAKKALEVSGAEMIDINMGCPMPKIANNGDGSALLENPALAAEIVSAVKNEINGAPVTVKMRLGRDRGHIVAVDFAKEMERAGADALCVHGRTRVQMYSGTADWDTIAAVKKAVSLPLIANGDINGPEAALKCLRITGADGLMIGRACFGDPWIFSRVRAALEGLEIPAEPTLAEKCEAVAEQFELSRKFHGDRLACLIMRKHWAWYLRGVRHGAYFREQVTKFNSPEEFYALNRRILRELGGESR